MSKAQKKVKDQTEETSSIVTAEHQAKLDSLKTKSDKIRYMTAEGYNRSEIAKHIGVIYQFVRNVQVTPLKGNKPS